MTFHRAVPLCLGGAVLALAAFFGWGAGSSAAATGAIGTHRTVATRSGTSGSPAGMAADQRIANDARLRLSDLPAGWVGGSAASRPTADAPCPSLRRAAGWISAGKISPAFSVSTGNPLTAQTETYIYADTALAKHWFGEFSSRQTRACLARILRTELATTVELPGITLGKIRIHGIAVAAVGDQDSAFRVTVPVFGSGVTLEVDVDVVFVRTGRGLEIFSLGALGRPFDPTLEGTVLNHVTARLATDLQRPS
jgi:hypothetical protein